MHGSVAGEVESSYSNIDYYHHIQVEEFIKDRELLTWGFPDGGESVVDVRRRIRDQFLTQLMAEAGAKGGESCRVLVASHGLFLLELHSVLGTMAVSSKDNFGDSMFFHTKNTFVCRYNIDVDSTGTGAITDVACTLFHCYKHLNE